MMLSGRCTIGLAILVPILAFVSGPVVGRQQDAPSAAAANPAATDVSKLPPGYLPHEQLPDSLALLPPPPAAGSAAMANDEAARRSAVGLRSSARFGQAATDAVIGLPEIPNDFSCAAGFKISNEATPRLYALIAKMLIDVGLSTYRAKDHYKRTRPFVVHNAPTCYPKDEPTLRNDGSYPSGHSAIGWGIALVLAEVVPSRADAVLQRGRDFGQSRLICDAHWQSDIDAGRVIAAATVARLHGEPVFRADLEAARAEATATLATASSVQLETCRAEAAALSSG